MKNLLSFALAIFLAMTSAVTFAAEPTCVFIKFANDTRYKNLDAAEVLSDLVLEKLLASGKVNLVETRPIDKDIESMLYNETVREIANVQSAMTTGNFNVMFEGAAFNPNQIDSISVAEVGQIISPTITSQIGKENGAEYLIQGTIINLGNGSWSTSGENFVNGMIGGLIGHALGAKSSSSMLGSHSRATAIGLQCDLRIIKASTGEVIWRDIVAGYAGKEITAKNRSLDKLTKLQSEMYASVMENAADAICKTIVDDIDNGELFSK